MTLEEQAILKLLEMDIPSNAARSSVHKVIDKSVAGQPLSSVVKKAFRLALNMETASRTEPQVKQGGDLRNASEDNAYDHLKSSGSIARTPDEF